MDCMIVSPTWFGVVTEPYLKTFGVPTRSSRLFVPCPVASRLIANC